MQDMDVMKNHDRKLKFTNFNTLPKIHLVHRSHHRKQVVPEIHLILISRYWSFLNKKVSFVSLGRSTFKSQLMCAVLSLPGRHYCYRYGGWDGRHKNISWDEPAKTQITKTLLVHRICHWNWPRGGVVLRRRSMGVSRGRRDCRPGHAGFPRCRRSL